MGKVLFGNGKNLENIQLLAMQDLLETVMIIQVLYWQWIWMDFIKVIKSKQDRLIMIQTIP
ncbi:hypothetical protein C1645_781378 [Glomus cerebriforme]|uniref:Uncharacterized protein n=1 Tax=Glomus cerebriforme TaxID=658196 RepID=A0A397SHD1_9GLOM|nr:hypothetical protein C1645_781378 [Glomus cerebriforme]